MSDYKITDVNKVKRGPNRATYDVATINTIIDAGFIAHVSYIYEGKAISIPMAYARIEDKIYIHGSLKNRMLLALLEAKEASLTIMHLDGLVLARSGFHHSVNYRSATIFGSVKELKGDEEKTIILKAIVDQMIPGRWDSLREMTDKERNSTLVVEVKIETASAKIRDVGVVDEKADESLPIWAGVVPVKQVALPPISDNKLSNEVKVPQHVLAYYNQNKA
ncbi:pyridoxamine 5'-phosphate oxidase family protein [uncultured Maribacter sp.]|uniref:pyridoxamine 5'-phosphate oxidase family protein n=1 Tax=uncultured Maribacter sp. TaxID=431308 RepID=UPI002601D677|nr:pyridoxamine 5'-phosphate oxidase family protein [uncultured Maribacter sp.]